MHDLRKDTLEVREGERLGVAAFYRNGSRTRPLNLDEQWNDRGGFRAAADRAGCGHVLSVDTKEAA